MLFPLETLEKLLEQWIKQGNVLFSFPLRHDMNCTSRQKEKKQNKKKHSSEGRLTPHSE